MGRRIPGWVAVGAVAFLLRLGYLVLVDEPLLFRHQYHYFRGGLLVAENPHPWSFIVHSDEWRMWDGMWTLAPGYFWFLAAGFRLGGFHLFPIQVAQCVLEAGTAVLVALLARHAATPRLGLLAGFVYALYWPSVEQPSRTMTENLHTFLLVAAFAAVIGLVLRAGRDGAAAEPLRKSAGRGLCAGMLFGLSALARAVGMAFLPLTLVWLVFEKGPRRRWAAAAGVVAGLGLVIAPWVARNWWVIGDPSPIESVSLANLWEDNAFARDARFERQHHYLLEAQDAREREALVWRFVLRGLRERGHDYPAKVWGNVRHFLRPDGLWLLLGAEQPWPAWQHATRVVLDDGIVFLTLPLFVAFLAGGRPPALRRFFLLWTAYYLLMILVFFHSEIRYRSPLMPFVIAGAAGGLAAVRAPGARAARLGLLVGGLVSVLCVMPYAGRAWRALEARWRLRAGAAALARGDVGGLQAALARAVEAAPTSSRPWFTAGRWLAASGRSAEALEAYARGEPLVEYKWIPRTVLPRLLADVGRTEDAARAAADANAASFDGDPWLLLQTAWRELPPPRGTVIELSRGDYGAVRGFLYPLEGRRWTRHRAFLRLIPPPARAYEVTLEMASPPPAWRADPTVTVRVRGGAEARFTLTSEMRPYRFVTPAPPDGVVRVDIESPTWNRASETAEQGVQVSRMTVVPAGG
ncbi:MAG TPA: glycosyltransferase family 39 protein [Vicinamibacteria bacterium]|nr:glycosyltransferase family 39 protein [Vicinamibacteria bacterium]